MVDAIRNENMRQGCMHGGMAWPHVQKKTDNNESRNTLSPTHICHSQELDGAKKGTQVPAV